MTTDHHPLTSSHTAYRDSGVDTDEADIGLSRLVKRITPTWPRHGNFGAVLLPIGYFANVIDVGGIGLAICTDGVGSKAIIAKLMNKYDTIGIDCVAVNVNDLICVGARPRWSIILRSSVSKRRSSMPLRLGWLKVRRRQAFLYPAVKPRSWKTSSGVLIWREPPSAQFRSTRSLPVVIWNPEIMSSALKAAASTVMV